MDATDVMRVMDYGRRKFWSGVITGFACGVILLALCAPWGAG
jgi:dolichol kinase